MRATLFTIDAPCAGRLSTMAKPRGDDWLDEEMAALRDEGVDVLVSALTPAEMRETGLGGEPESARAAGLEFVPLPIPDRAVPDPDAVLPELRRLAARLDAGAHVVTHCRFGVGRSSLLAASLLVLGGLDAEDAWTRIAAARGRSVPDTAEQRAWVARIATPT
ncbi:protein-tyrosine phosphatase [Murinocardiopsis flavida]|uniref:protein-tyrosine-phosphatase n=1 Tax=Murinocardiopsis flavida TaxID=645275 RepID=A0A2P8CF41_9ACTN|nr:tyrosine protein phosphatase [Murinocardiopsis flavida]PSK83566.1 protein-tyrosine phosphatase [Murinocardiopsis flavida]